MPTPPPTWEANIHEDDGGDDSVGLRQQHGQQLLRDELLGMLQRDGVLGAWDEVNHTPLDPVKVAEARRAETKHFADMNVYTRVPRSHQAQTGGSTISTKWVDVNKQDDNDPLYRSRLVGREYRVGADDRLYAATRALEALRSILVSLPLSRETGQ